MEEQFYDILGKRLSGGKLTEEEEKILAQCISKPEYKEIYKDINNTWELTGQITAPQPPDIDKEWNRFLELKKQTKNKTISLKPILWLAASIVLILGLTTFFFINNTSTTRFATTGQVKEIKLPDGSTVILNKNSSLSYNEDFGVKNRLVEMNGEALFKVKKSDKKLSFKINSPGDIVTEVLGTSFNLNARDDSKTAQLTVLTGKVSFGKESETRKAIFIKNQQATINLETGKIKTPEKYDKNLIAWQTKHLEFNAEALSSVAKTCSEYFGKKIILPAGFNDKKFSGKFTNPKPDEFAEIIASTFSLKYEINEKSIVFKVE